VSDVARAKADKVAMLERLRNQVLDDSISDAKASMQESDLETNSTKASDRTSAGLRQ